MDHLDPISLVVTERKRQVQLGYGRAHDDAHNGGELALAAAAYALAGSGGQHLPEAADYWPWPDGRPAMFGADDDVDALALADTSMRREALVKAAALCCAEIERLQRASQ